MIIHEAVQAGITPADTDRLTGPINLSGIASNSAPNLQLNTHAQEPNRLDSPLNPKGIVFEGSQTRYEEMRGAVSEVLRDIGIRDVTDREEMLRSFDRLHEGEEKAVADFQAALGDFKDGTVDPILQQFYDLIADSQKIGSYINLGAAKVELTSLVGGYLAIDYLRRRHLKNPQHPSYHRTARRINKLGRSLSWVAAGSTLLAACTSATGVISSTSTPSALGLTDTSATPYVSGSPSPGAIASETPVPDPTVSPTSTETSPPSPTIAPSKTPTPKETQRPGEIIFLGDFNSPLILTKNYDPGNWHALDPDATTVEIVQITDITSNPELIHDAQGMERKGVLKITVSGEPVAHPEWGSNILWWTGYPYWRNRHETLPAPSAIQVDLLNRSGLGGSFLSVHRLNKVTNDTISVAAIEMDPDGKVKLLVRDGSGLDRRVYLKSNIYRPRQWNTFRMEFREDGTVVPFINNQYAYNNGQVPLKVPVDDSHDAGFTDGHAGYLMGIQPGQSGWRPEKGQVLLNDNFRIEKLKP